MWQYLTRPTAASRDSSDVSEATPSSTSASSSSTFARLSSYVYDKAADVAFDLAPVEQSLSLLRISAVLVELSHLVYVTHTADVQQQTHVDLPLLGNFSNRRSVACKLLHFRSATCGNCNDNILTIQNLSSVIATLESFCCTEHTCSADSVQGSLSGPADTVTTTVWRLAS